MSLRRVFKSKRTGEFILSSTEQDVICGYQWVQEYPSDVWAITHGNESFNIAAQVYVDDELVIPNELVILNGDQFEVKFSEPVSGYVNFIAFKEDGFSSSGSLGPTIVLSFPFASPFTTATNVGPTQQRFDAAGISSDTNGYNAGGDSAPPFPNSARTTVTRFPFSIPFVSSDTVGNLTTGTRLAGGAYSDINGYVLGGAGPQSPLVLTSKIEEFPFSAPFTTATNIGSLTRIIFRTRGHSSSNNGFSSGGSTPPGPSPDDTVDSFPFSDSFTTASTVGNLTERVSYHGSHQG